MSRSGVQSLQVGTCLFQVIGQATCHSAAVIVSLLVAPCLRDERETALQNINSNGCLLHRCIADYIGGMTDQFAYDEFDRLYGTRI